MAQTSDRGFDFEKLPYKYKVRFQAAIGVSGEQVDVSFTTFNEDGTLAPQPNPLESPAAYVDGTPAEGSYEGGLSFDSYEEFAKIAGFHCVVTPPSSGETYTRMKVTFGDAQRNDIKVEAGAVLVSPPTPPTAGFFIDGLGTVPVPWH